MKRFVIFILCNLLTFFTYAGVIPYPGLREKIAHDPESSLLLLDSLEEKGAIPQYGIDYLRALSYRTQSRYYMCMYYATHALNNPEIQRDSVLTSYTYMLLAESSVASFQLAEAADMITKGKEYAEKANDQLLRANMLQMEGGLYRNMGVLNKSYECLQEAVFPYFRTYPTLRRSFCCHIAWVTSWAIISAIGSLRKLGRWACSVKGYCVPSNRGPM